MRRGKGRGTVSASVSTAAVRALEVTGSKLLRYLYYFTYQVSVRDCFVVVYFI